ncbi:unnamed protein product [Microthlaspi erraticum]|uniref:Protein kinase domain-containing protein n=1 Tax=Microthlaspi erraticum TaxID=1685480 RepID=A0A6D2IJ51_9BRAS|nr:unnamed protein product [Microthlaspi erraticum]
MPKGSLDHHIYAHTKLDPGLPQEYPVLNWETRMSIAMGVAEALNYLHGTLRVIHRDVKVANVLLDDNFVPRQILDWRVRWLQTELAVRSRERSVRSREHRDASHRKQRSRLGFVKVRCLQLWNLSAYAFH